MESSEPPDQESPMYPPPEWLNSRYDPWINKPDIGETTGEQAPQNEPTTGEIILWACKLGYITPDDLMEFDGDRRTILDGIAAYIEKHGENATEVFRGWGVEYRGKTE